MRLIAPPFLLVILLLAVGCGNNQQNAQTPATAPTAAPQTAAVNTANAPQNEQKTDATDQKPKTGPDACSLISSDELQAIQGEALKETKLSNSPGGPLVSQQCVYLLPTYSKSLSLQLIQGDAASIKKSWEDKFRQAEEEEKETGREKGREGKGEKGGAREKKEGAGGQGGGREGEEEEESKPVRVTGIGEEAFWIGNRIVGALYVFSNNSILRLSIGGPENEEAKIKKLKVLAQKAINRLK